LYLNKGENVLRVNLLQLGDFFVEGVFTATRTVLLEFNLVWGVGTVAFRDVVEVLALRTSQTC